MSLPAWFALAAAVPAGWWLSTIVRHYALARAILDVPNERSSHSQPTPRGGGLAIALVTSATVVLALAAGALRGAEAAALLGGVPVALVGWLDDRRPLPARVRLVVHLAAAVWAVAWLGAPTALRVGELALPLGALGGPLAVVAVVWLLNLYNFMDGIDGLAGGEALVVGAAGGILLVAGGSTGLGAVSLAVAASSLGFLVVNWPPARLFMGDVGSGFLGFTFGVLALAGERAGTLPLWSWIVLLGVFVVDASVTLLRRLARGESLAAAHRHHAYQRLVQAGWRHAQVSGAALLVSGALAVAVAAAVRHPARQLPTVLGGLLGLILLYVLVERIRPMGRRS